YLRIRVTVWQVLFDWSFEQSLAPVFVMTYCRTLDDTRITFGFHDYTSLLRMVLLVDDREGRNVGEGSPDPYVFVGRHDELGNIQSQLSDVRGTAVRSDEWNVSEPNADESHVRV